MSGGRRSSDGAYWDEIALDKRTRIARSVSRAYSDAAHAALLRRWLPAEPVARLLKTDLFEESCGAGLAPVLEGRARRVVGVDVSGGTIAAAKARHAGIAATRADVRRLPFRDAAFDLVVSSSTLDHFDSRAQIVESLAEIRRVLRPAGTLVVTLDNLLHPPLALRNAAPWLWRGLGIVPYRVGATYGPGGLRRALERSGLRVVETGALLHFPRLPAEILVRLLAPRGAAAPRAIAALMACERLGRWPTRFLTGQFVAARAVRD